MDMSNALTLQVERMIDYLTSDKLMMYMNLNHAIIVANIVYNQIQPTKSPIIGVIFMTIAGMGGATTNALLASKSHPIFTNDFFLYKMLRKMTQTLVFELPCFLFEGYFVGYVIQNNVKRALLIFPNSQIFAPIICGGLGGCGGGIIFPYILMSFKKNFNNYNTLLRSPSFGMISSFICSSYYLLFRNLPTLKVGNIIITHEFIAGTIMAIAFARACLLKDRKKIFKEKED
eukprot:gene12028-5427_t